MAKILSTLLITPPATVTSQNPSLRQSIISGNKKTHLKSQQQQQQEEEAQYQQKSEQVVGPSSSSKRSLGQQPRRSTTTHFRSISNQQQQQQRENDHSNAAKLLYSKLDIKNKAKSLKRTLHHHNSSSSQQQEVNSQTTSLTHKQTKNSSSTTLSRLKHEIGKSIGFKSSIKKPFNFYQNSKESFLQQTQHQQQFPIPNNLKPMTRRDAVSGSVESITSSRLQQKNQYVQAWSSVNPKKKWQD